MQVILSGIYSTDIHYKYEKYAGQLQKLDGCFLGVFLDADCLLRARKMCKDNRCDAQY